MKLTEKQTKLVGLTMELDIKTREYKKLCQEFDGLKKIVKSENDIRLLDLYKKFEQNQKEIDELVSKLRELKKED